MHLSTLTSENTLKESRALKMGQLSSVSSRGTMGAFYRPQKVKGHPSDMTLEKTTQSLRNIILTSCMCQLLNVTQQNEAFSLR